jgi:hypothetical protein
MYALLGDPALALPLPALDLDVLARRTDAGRVEVEVLGPVPKDAKAEVTIEIPRERDPVSRDAVPPRRTDAEIVATHAAANRRVVAHATLALSESSEGRSRGRVTLPAADLDPALPYVVKAVVVEGTAVHLGAVSLPALPSR